MKSEHETVWVCNYCKNHHTVNDGSSEVTELGTVIVQCARCGHEQVYTGDE